MTELHEHNHDEVDQLLLNAALRDALEPFLDESVNMVDSHTMTTWKENEYLASMLAWERAPLLPLSSWFEPELKLPDPDDLADQELHDLLWDTLNKLYDNHIVLDYTDHLSDRKLYCLIVRDILSAEEKKLHLPKNYLHWHCLDWNTQPDPWLRYYATAEERDRWALHTGDTLPPSEPAPYPRQIPSRPPNN